MSESNLLYHDLTKTIIGAAIEVHKILGCGFLESVYEEALTVEFGLNKIPFERQKNIDIFYKNKLAKYFICDFLVYDKIIVELKAIKKTTDIEIAQLLNYLKAGDFKLGLLFNFGTESLEFRRIINDQ